MGALLGLLLLERRLDSRSTARHDDVTGPIAFHPELIVRWDDEADYARSTACTRRSIAHRPAVRPLEPVFERRSNTR